jgi:hypothetical protein
MITLRSGLILTLVLTTAIFAGCSGSAADSNAANAEFQPAANSAPEPPKTNAEELGMLVNMNYESEEVYWKDDPAHKKITAVIKYSPEVANQVVADAVRVREPEAAAISPESWFPPELVAQSEMSGNDTIKGKSYAATVFLQDPYNEGRIIRINDTDYFVLEVGVKQP